MPTINKKQRRASSGSMDEFLQVLLTQHNVVPSQVYIIQDNASTKDQDTRRSSFSGCLSPVINDSNKNREIDPRLSSSSHSTSTSSRSAQDLKGFEQVLLSPEDTQREL